MLVPMFSSASARSVGVAIGAGLLGVDANDVQVHRVRVARVALERVTPSSSSTATS